MCILALVVVFLLIVFFAPVKYMSQGRKYEDGLNIQALVTYLNPIVRVEVHYPDETIVKVKILFFTIYPRKPKVKDDEQKETKNESVAEKPKKQADEGTGKHQKTVKPVDEPKRDKQECEATEIEPEQNSSKDSALDTVGYYVSLLKENKELILDVLKIILGAVKTILPRKCNINAVFGTGQADTTGFIYGAYCSLREYLPGEIILEPVWTESHIEGEYCIKGKIRLIHFLVAVIKIIANKKVRLLIKKLRRA